jgi:hypothetical protein
MKNMEEIRFQRNEYGDLDLVNKTFEGQQFNEILLAPAAGTQLAVRQVVFTNCVTSPGTCRVLGGVTLDDVSFIDLDCGDALRLCTESVRSHVLVSGDCPKSLIVQPATEHGYSIPAAVNTDWQLDISQFTGEVVVVGMRGNMVRKDPNMQATVQSAWAKDIPWKDLGIGPFSYWRLFIKKLNAFGTEEGVFSLPDVGHKHHAEVMREKAVLEKTGLSFA